jgi:hypothetical protein
MNITKYFNWLKIAFNLNFTTSKLLAYIIVGLGAYVSLKLNTDSPFTIGVIASTALFGVKVWGDGKKVSEVV